MKERHKKREHGRIARTDRLCADFDLNLYFFAAAPRIPMGDIGRSALFACREHRHTNRGRLWKAICSGLRLPAMHVELLPALAAKISA